MTARKMKFSGDRLRDIRQSKGISQLQMSNDCGLNQSLVSKYERGEVVSPPHHTVEAMADYLGVDADDFLEGLKNSGEKAKRSTEQAHRVDVHVYFHFHTEHANNPES